MDTNSTEVDSKSERTGSTTSTLLVVLMAVYQAAEEDVEADAVDSVGTWATLAAVEATAEVEALIISTATTMDRREKVEVAILAIWTCPVEVVASLAVVVALEDVEEAEEVSHRRSVTETSLQLLLLCKSSSRT
jgi:hypothetical protein